MKKQTILMLVVAVLLLCSCSVQKRADRKCAKAQKRYELASYKWGCAIFENNSTTNTIIKDTTIYVPVPGATVHDSVKVPYLATFSTPKNILETTYAISTAWIENSLLQHTLVQKQTNIPATIPGAIHNTVSVQEKIIKVPYPVEKRVKAPLHWFVKFLVYSGATAWMLAIAYILFKFRKAIIPGLPF